MLRPPFVNMFLCGYLVYCYRLQCGAFITFLFMARVLIAE